MSSPLPKKIPPQRERAPCSRSRPPSTGTTSPLPKKTPRAPRSQRNTLDDDEEEEGDKRRGEDIREIRYNGPEDGLRGLEALSSRTSSRYGPSVLSRSASRVSFHPHHRSLTTLSGLSTFFLALSLSLSLSLSKLTIFRLSLSSNN